MDMGKPVDIVYLDFPKAFDRVAHVRLIYKIKSYGINGKLLKWIENFLQGWTQQVIVDGHHTDSNPISVTSGVPQGTVLAPLLFYVI